MRSTHPASSGTSTSGAAAASSRFSPYSTNAGASGTSTIDPSSDPHSFLGVFFWVSTYPCPETASLLSARVVAT